MSQTKNKLSIQIVILFLVLLFAVVYLIMYYSQMTADELSADTIVNDVWTNAEKKRNVLLSDDTEENNQIIGGPGRLGYFYTVLDEESTSSLVLVETYRKFITPGVCKALKNKLIQDQWQGAFDYVMVLDVLKNEKLDILANNCSDEEIPMLRFYVRFATDAEASSDLNETVNEENTEQEEIIDSEPVSNFIPTPSHSPTSTTHYSRPASHTSKTITCPSGTSSKGRGGYATPGCRCNGDGESWNGKSCEQKGCPQGSSKDSSNTGDMTNVSGCRCKTDTPRWNKDRCIAVCSGNKTLINGKCVCASGTVAKKNSNDQCVECNINSDCLAGYRCVDNICVNEQGNKTITKQDDQNDCRWGVCQTCDNNKIRSNLPDQIDCSVGGLNGLCNGNGTCYPIQAQRCSSVRGCPKGEFCNFGGKFNSTKKQRGIFGQTPNVCQVVEAQQFEYNDITYYYNSKKSLQEWCRAANNKANCMWGYLAKQGAESWCASLGKRLLTLSEMSQVWNALKEHLPQTYTGYSYWIQEGTWIADTKGRQGFSKAHPDGYGGKGGVVCR